MSVCYNYIPNFLSTTELKNIFDFNLKYLSAVKTQTEIAKQEKARFENNRNLNRAFRFAKGETAERLESFKARLFEGLERNVAIAKEEAEAARAAKLLRFTNKLKISEKRFIKRPARHRLRLLPSLIMKLYRMIFGSLAPIMMPQSGSNSASFPFSSCRNSSG